MKFHFVFSFFLCPQSIRTGEVVVRPPGLPNQLHSVLIDHKCYSEYGCFFHPYGCMGLVSCNSLTSYRKFDNDWLMITLAHYTNSTTTASTLRYVALGISLDNKMGNDMVAVCFSDGKVDSYKNDGHNSVPIADKNASFVELVKQGWDRHAFWCHFKLKAKATINNIHFDLLNTKYYLFLATGDYDDSGIKAHKTDRTSVDFPAISNSKVDMTDNGFTREVRWKPVAPTLPTTTSTTTTTTAPTTTTTSSPVKCQSGILMTDQILDPSKSSLSTCVINHYCVMKRYRGSEKVYLTCDDAVCYKAGCYTSESMKYCCCYNSSRSCQEKSFDYVLEVGGENIGNRLQSAVILFTFLLFCVNKLQLYYHKCSLLYLS